jgi:hypothetical protein
MKRRERLAMAGTYGVLRTVHMYVCRIHRWLTQGLVWCVSTCARTTGPALLECLDLIVAMADSVEYAKSIADLPGSWTGGFCCKGQLNAGTWLLPPWNPRASNAQEAYLYDVITLYVSSYTARANPTRTPQLSRPFVQLSLVQLGGYWEQS